MSIFVEKAYASDYAILARIVWWGNWKRAVIVKEEFGMWYWTLIDGGASGKASKYGDALADCKRAVDLHHGSKAK